MPTYRISIVNEHFSQAAEQDAPDVAEAWKSAIGSAIAIAADQVSHGNPLFRRGGHAGRRQQADRSLCRCCRCDSAARSGFGRMTRARETHLRFRLNLGTL